MQYERTWKSMPKLIGSCAGADICSFAPSSQNQGAFPLPIFESLKLGARAEKFLVKNEWRQLEENLVEACENKWKKIGKI